MDTKIPYARKNYETVGGCDKIKSGCKNCYAIPLIHRMNCCQKKRGRYAGLVKDGEWTGKIKLFYDRLEQPLHRTIPTTYFVNSRSDLWHKDVPFEFIDRMFAVMEQCPQHKFLLFTKRWEIAHTYLVGEERGMDEERNPNIHLYFSASTQAEVDEAVPILLEIPVAVRGLSLEPLLGPIVMGFPTAGSEVTYELLSSFYGPAGFDKTGGQETRLLPRLHSIIVGCESGPNRRLCKLEEIKSVADQCKAAGVQCYVKQIPIDSKCIPLDENTGAIWPAWATREMPK